MKRSLPVFLAIILCVTVLGGCKDQTGPTGSAKSSSYRSELSSGDESLIADASSEDATSLLTSGESQTNASNSSRKASSSVSSKAPASSAVWAPTYKNYTAEQLDAPYPLRKNIKGEVKVFTPFATEQVHIKATDMFKKAYPNAQITLITTTNGMQDQKLMALIAADTPPDYVFSTYQNYPMRAKNKLTMPIDDYIQPRIGQSSILMNGTMYKGKKYIVCDEGLPSVMFFNKTMFQRKGEKTPLDYMEENNWTWSTFRAAAKRMTDASQGISGFATDADSFFTQAAGQDVIKIVSGVPQLNIVNNKKWRDAAQLVVDMINVDKSMFPDKWGANTKYVAGKVAMILPNGDFKGILKDAGISDYGIAIMPKKDKSSQYCGFIAGINGGFSIAAGAKNIQGGMAFGEMMWNAQMELKGNMTYDREGFALCQKYNVQPMYNNYYGYGNVSGDYDTLLANARLGQKSLDTLVQEFLPVLKQDLKPYQE